MKLDAVQLSIEPRSIGGCVDLAGLLYRAHLKQILVLVGIFGLPSLILSFWATRATEMGLLVALTLYFLFSPFLGAALVAAIGPWVFGERFDTRRALRHCLSQFLPLSFYFIVWRILILVAGTFGIFPALFVSTYSGFYAEALLLERLPRKRRDLRLRELLHQRVMALNGRNIVISVYFAGLVLSLFLLIDAISGLVFGYPIAFGRDWGPFFWDEAVDALFFDPTAVCLLLGVMWLAYPLARLAWFLSYLDVRIRKESWDLELDFKLEAELLEAGR